VRRNYEQAYIYYKKYTSLNDSLFTADYADQITEWQTRYETNKKEQELQIQKAENQKKEAELKRKNIVLISFIGFIVVVLVFSVLLYKQFAAKKKANILLQEQNEEIKNQRDKIFNQNKEITDSIEYASKIQSAILPPKDIISEKLPEHFILYKPRDIVSGDFYWLYPKNNKIYLCAADCTGHGVPGAFMSMLGIALLNEIISKSEVNTADKILNFLRDYVVRSLHQTGEAGETQDGMDIAFCVIEPDKKQLQFAGAFNPLFLIRNGELYETKGDKMPIGVHLRQNEPFTNHIIPIKKNDKIYLFSDGYTDQFGGPKRKKFLMKRFRELLVEINQYSMEDQKIRIDKEFNDWKGDYEQIDDILVFGIKI
jgi:serine phosphatase RsbU (regulator of sigma subunit)